MAAYGGAPIKVYRPLQDATKGLVQDPEIIGEDRRGSERKENSPAAALVSSPWHGRFAAPTCTWRPASSATTCSTPWSASRSPWRPKREHSFGLVRRRRAALDVPIERASSEASSAHLLVVGKVVRDLTAEPGRPRPHIRQHASATLSSGGHDHASAHRPTRSARRTPPRIRTRCLSCADEIVGTHRAAVLGCRIGDRSISCWATRNLKELLQCLVLVQRGGRRPGVDHPRWNASTCADCRSLRNGLSIDSAALRG
jgi:hypothetical protein